MLFKPLKVCLGFSFSWLLDLFNFYGENKNTKQKISSVLEQLDWRFWQSGPGAIKQTTTKTGNNAENCDTLSETGSWWWWSFRFDNIQKLSQLILSKRKHRNNSITTRKWTLVGETRRAATSVSPGKPSLELLVLLSRGQAQVSQEALLTERGSAGRGKWRMESGGSATFGNFGNKKVLGGEEIF